MSVLADWGLAWDPASGSWTFQGQLAFDWRWQGAAHSQGLHRFRTLWRRHQLHRWLASPRRDALLAPMELTALGRDTVTEEETESFYRLAAT
eukprot:5794003-Alexandrium_andersonii.AAC.1